MIETGHNICALVRDVLPLYLDGDLDGEAARTVEAHLRSCPECQLVAEQYSNSPVRPRPAPSLEQDDLTRHESRLIRRAGRTIVLVLVVLALVVGAVAGWSYLSARRAGHRAAQNAFLLLQLELSTKPLEAAGSIDLFAAEGPEGESLTRAAGFLQATGEHVYLMRYLDDAVFGQRRVQWEQAYADAMRETAEGLQFVRDRLRGGYELQVDRDYLAAVRTGLEGLFEALRLAEGSSGGTYPKVRFTDEHRSAVVQLSGSLQALSQAYLRDGALVFGTRVPAVDALEATVIACRFAGTEPFGEAPSKQPNRILNWWSDIHHWDVTVSDAAPERAGISVSVDARTGEVVGWTESLWGQAGTTIPESEVISNAVKYLHEEYTGEAVLLVYGRDMTGQWWLVFALRGEDGVVNFADPIVIGVAAEDGRIIGHTRRTRTAAGAAFPSAQVSRKTAALIAASHAARVMGAEPAPKVTSESPAWYRERWGGIAPSWAFTYEMTPTYREQLGFWVRDQASYTGPTHLVVFVNVRTGEVMGTERLWLEGTTELAATGWIRYGSVVRE